MKIQSLSIVVPAKRCINNCKFCVAKTEKDIYGNFITGRNLYFDLYYKQYKERMEYARDNGCNTVMLTGNCEPQQNYEFLKMFGIINQSLKSPFKNIELQTTGTLIDNDYLYFLRHHVGVTTISLSISNFDDDINDEIIGAAQPINTLELAKKIKKYQFNLRMSINLNKTLPFEGTHNLFFHMLKEIYHADQITFRVLYDSGSDLPQDKWVRENAVSQSYVDDLTEYIVEKGNFLEVLEFGAKRYSVNGMSTVVDNDCMSKEAKDAVKFLILRPDCKLYTKWDDKGSLLF